MSGEWQLRFAPDRPPALLEAIAQSAAAALADPLLFVRRCAGECCSLFFTDRLPQSGPALVQRGRVWPAGEGGAAARVAALTSVEPDRYFERTHQALGTRYRLERTVAVSPERVLFEAHDLVLKRRVSLRVNFFCRPADPDLVRSRGRGARPAGPPVDPARLRRRGHR